ncbi:unnamed protein product [Blepharisma stoltei]|uniref:Cytochrome b-c1 complex subunit 8 n=1 Tax=Blepharisma stoltei TaxID=1481888 RepID=A0AAU9IA00_9CILI|nr:unnamed protein product [Blepharisma stoltei]
MSHLEKMDKIRGHYHEPEPWSTPGRFSKLADKIVWAFLGRKQRITVRGTPPDYEYGFFSRHVPSYQGVSGAFKVVGYLAILYLPVIPYYLGSKGHKFRLNAYE